MIKNIYFLAVILPVLGLVQNTQNQISEVSSIASENIQAVLSESSDAIICNKGTDGRCFRKGMNLVMCGEYTVFDCEFTGFQYDYCNNPCSSHDVEL